MCASSGTGAPTSTASRIMAAAEQRFGQADMDAFNADGFQRGAVLGPACWYSTWAFRAPTWCRYRRAESVYGGWPASVKSVTTVTEVCAGSMDHQRAAGERSVVQMRGQAR